MTILLYLTFLVLLTLQLMGFIAISWFLVFLPLLIPLFLIVTVLLFAIWIS